MAEGTTDEHSSVSWLELLQDLVFVVLALSLFGGLHHAWGSEWVAWYAVAIVYVYGAWLAWVLLNNRFPMAGIAAQALSAVWVAGTLVAATGTLWDNSSSPDTLAAGLALSIAALGGAYAVAARRHPSARRAARFASAASLVTAAALTLAVFTPLESEWLIAVAPAVALIALLGIYPRLLPDDVIIRRHYLQERFGQLVLILMGDALLETVLNVNIGATLSLAGLTLAVAVLFLLWRAYFLRVLPAAPPRTRGRLNLWMTAHLVVMIGVGFSAAVLASSASPLPVDVAGWLEIEDSHLPLGVIVGVAYLGFAWVMIHADSPSRRVATAFFVCAAVTIAGAVILELLHAPDASTALLLLLTLVAVDAATLRATTRERARA